MRIKKTILLLVVLCSLFFILGKFLRPTEQPTLLSEEVTTTAKSMFFFNKDAYKEPVWEDLLEQEIVHFQDVEDAFHAYYDDENHLLSHDQHEAWEKIERAAKSQLDGQGKFKSKDRQYRELLNYRIANQNPDAPSASVNLTDPTSYTLGIPNDGNAGRWKNIGPFGNPEVQWSATGNGALQYVEMHPTNPAIMYTCARNRGLWKTTNYGANWIPLTDHFCTPHIESVEVNTSNPDIMYLGGVDRIWYSTDGAINWTEVFNESSADIIHEIHSDPINPNLVIATTEGGIYRSTDAGQNWTEIFDGRFVHLDISADWSLMITADDSEDIAPTLSLSQDKGATWNTITITTEYTKVDKFYLAITETSPKQVYAYGLKSGNTPTTFIGLWKSDYDPNPVDGQSYFNFTRQQHSSYAYPNGPTPLTVANNTDGYKAETEDYYGSVNPHYQATWIGDFWVSPNNPDRLLTLREKFWGSEDGGIIWDWRPSYGSSNWADNRYVTMNVAKDTIYWCNDGGIWCAAESDLFPTEAVVNASGMSSGEYRNSKVVPKNGDICVIEGSEMDVSQMNKDVVMTGGQDIGQIFTRNGRDAHIASADVYRGRMKPTNDSLFHTGGLYVKVDGGSDTYQVYNNINADYHNSDRMYGYTIKNTTQDINTTILVRSPADLDAWPVNSFRGEGQSNTGGHGWTPVNNQWETFTTSAGISSIKAGTFEQSKANAEIAFLGDENGGRLFITNNLSARQPTWSALSKAPSSSRYRIATHQYNENIISLGTDSGIYISKDKGNTWAKRSALPEGSPSVVLMDKNRTEGIYVMTSMTVYYIDQSLTNWIEFNQGQPLHQNQDMRIAYYPNGDNRLYVGKYGSGVWGSPLYSVLADNNDMPVVDFRIHGNSENIINSGEAVQLIDLSMNYTSLSWVVENGGEVHHVGNEKFPSFTLTTSGFYKVTLTATNSNGSKSSIKEQYIEVLGAPVVSTSPSITNNHQIQSANSATITSQFSDAVNVLESGVLYAPFDAHLNFNNATTITHINVLSNADNFDTPLSNLEYNVTYYYQTFLRDDGGLHFGPKQSLILAPYVSLSAESFLATKLNGTEWELKGLVFPNGQALTSVTLEHGINDFTNEVAIDISSLDIATTFNAIHTVDVANATTYQFRLKIVENGNTLYSNIYTFLPTQNLCSPTITNYVWYKRFIGVTFGDIVHENSSAGAYEDVTSTDLGELELGNSYTMQMKTRVSSWTNLSYIVYIDLNNDKDFDDYNEVVGSASPNGQFTDVNITIPSQDVIIGKDLLLRIVGHEGGTVNGCLSSIGNFKDFVLSIKGEGCTGTGHLISYFADTDNDGFGDPDQMILKNCLQGVVAGYVTNGEDCNDTNANANPNNSLGCVDDFPGTALDVQAGNSSVSVPNNSLFQFDSDTDFSVALWMRTNNWVRDASLISTKDWDSGGNKGWNLALATDDKGIDLNVGDGSNRADLQAGDINDGAWHHIAATFDRDGQVSLYIDGGLSQNASMSNVGDISNTLGLTIGADSENDYHFNGLIDEVSIWNKALSQAEIREQKHITLAGNNSNLIAYYQFNSNKSIAVEYINGLNGTLISNPIRSTATEPVGGGFANTQLEADGVVSFSSTDFTSTFVSQNGATIVASKITRTPNVLPVGLSRVFSEQYWAVHRYGSGAFEGSISFTLSEDLTTTDAANPDEIVLYGRTINGDGAWQMVDLASTVDAATNKVTFNSISNFDQFIIAATSDGTTGLGGCQTDVTYSNTNSMPDLTQSSTYIKAGNLNGNGAALILNGQVKEYKAGDYISLQAGFEVQAGAEFTATIEDCTPNLIEEVDKELAKISPMATTQVLVNELDMAISPNPFSTQATIQINLTQESKLSLQVFDRNGQLVESVVASTMFDKGQHHLTYTPKNRSNGFYYFVLQTEQEVLTKKVVIIGRE